MKSDNTLNKKTIMNCTAFYNVVIVLLLTSIISCAKTKSLPACSGNCTDITFSGTVYDMSANAPLRNVEIKIYMNPFVPGALFQPGNFIVASGKTGGDGTFLFHAQYDTGKFTSATLEVNASIPGGYIQYPGQIDPMAESGPSDIDALIFNPTYFTAFSHLSFFLFQKTLLQVHAHRTTPTVSGSSLMLQYSNNGIIGIGGFIQTDTNKDTTISVNTGANIYTVVTATKAISSTSYASTKDSIKCSKNGANAVDIYY